MLVYLIGLLGIYSFIWRFIVIKKKKSLGKRGFASVIAHRGSRSEGLPENTVAAFKDAASAGAHIVELDVWLTKDRKVVVHHDETLTRMSGGKNEKLITEVSLKDLPKIVPSKEQSDRCGSFNQNELNIPLFEDVLKSIPENVCIIIEFKQNSDFLISEVERLLGENNRKDSVYWFSLIEAINVKLRNYNPSIPTITSIPAVLTILAQYYLGILPFIDIKDAVFGITVEEITLEKVREEKAVASAPDWVKQLLAYFLTGKPPYAMLAPKLFAHLRRRGIPVWFLGVNNEEDLYIAIKSGATGVLTDRVNWLTNIIKTKNLVFKKID